MEWRSLDIPAFDLGARSVYTNHLSSSTCLRDVVATLARVSERTSLRPQILSYSDYEQTQIEHV